MKKILILTNNDIGLYNFRKELLQALIQEGYELHIALPYGSFVDKMQEMGCIYYDTEMDRRGKNPLQEAELINCYRKILKCVKPDLVLTYTIKPNIYGGSLCSYLNIPYITNITGLGTAVEGNGLLQKMTASMYRYAMRGVSCLFFQNKVNEAYFTKKKIGLGRHKMVPGSGVNLERYHYLEFPKEGAIEFLFISRVLKEKGIEQYLDTAEVIKKEYPETVFRILGFLEEDYEGKERLQKLCAEGIVIFEGMIADITPFLQRCQCTIHPSFYPEGMSNVCLESAASGRPVITTRRAGCADTVEEGVTGLLVEEQNSQDLIEKVRIFLAMSYEDRKQMGIRARQRIEKRFDRNIVIANYLMEIKKIIGTGRGSIDKKV